MSSDEMEVPQFQKDDSVGEWIRRALSSQDRDRLFIDMTDRFAALMITEALNLTGGNRSQAAKLLGLSRPTFLSKMEEYGITTQTAANWKNSKED